MAFKIAPRAIEVRQRKPRVEVPNHLDFIRSLPCLCCGFPRSEAAHISMAAPHLAKRSRGKGEKADDSWTVPLCSQCHARQHFEGEKKFWAGTNPFLLALALWRVTGDDELGQQIIRENLERR